MSKVVTLLMLLVATTSYAQFEKFAPKACQSGAQTSANTGAPGSILVAIVNGAYEISAGNNTGMNMSDGKAMAWIYVFLDVHADSVFFKPYGKIPFIGCQDASALLPSTSFPSAGLGRTVLPTDYIEGAVLISALNADGDYATFHTAHPDSIPAGTVLTVSQEPVLDFPAGTPFWLMTWVSQTPGGGLTCAVHAITKQTICVAGISSVADDAAAAGLVLAPNPAFDQATLTLPASWMGTTAAIEAVDATGSVVALVSSMYVTSPVVSIPLSSLLSGMYTVRIRNERQASVIPMSVVR
ncbi:MAG: T9SS type A sorting domain-containing protein [bacterium]|nr:T9SS type A sorting domain-containing protein [bacterium]